MTSIRIDAVYGRCGGSKSRKFSQLVGGVAFRLFREVVSLEEMDLAKTHFVRSCNEDLSCG